MGLKLLDDKNREDSFGGEYANTHLVEMLVGVPALPLEPFVVVGGLSPDTFPPSEVCFASCIHFVFYLIVLSC